MNRISGYLLGGLICLGPLSRADLQARPRTSILVEVQAGAIERRDVPLSVTLPEELATAKYLWMQQLNAGKDVPVQRSHSDPTQLTWILRDTLPARQLRQYRISASEFDRNRQEQVTVNDDGRTLSIRVRGKPVLTYHTAVMQPPQGVDPIFQRSGFIHPLQTPSGRVLTEAFPADHLHQHGIFNAWVKTKYNGREIDFWNQKGGTGTVEHAEVASLTSGPVYGECTTRLRHLALSPTTQPVTVLEETWHIRVYDFADRFVIDLETDQQCATDLPLTLEEYHYGGMSFRGTSAWLGQAGSDFLTSEGKTRADGNHSRPPWTDAYGLVDGQPCGVAVLQHSSNIRFPAPVRLHPEKPYFVYTPVVLGEMIIEPDQPLVSRYRYLVHDGPPDVRAITSASANYLEPPVVKILD